MIFRNDIFTLDGVRYRLLHVDNDASKAWVISLDGKTDAMPMHLPAQRMADLKADSLSPTEGNDSNSPTIAMLASQQRALALIGDLPFKVPAIFEPKARSEMIRQHSAKTSFSRKAIYKNLRRYWVGGQTASALLPHFRKCGASG